MLVASPLHHIVLGLAEEAMLRPEEGAQLKQVTAQPLEDSRGVFERRGNRGGMKKRADPGAAEFLWPKFWEIIEWKFNRHAVSYITSRRDNALRFRSAAVIVTPVTTAQIFANNSPCRV